MLGRAGADHGVSLQSGPGEPRPGVNYISTNYLQHLGGDGGEVREAEEVDEPHADEDGGEVLAHEVDGDQVDGEQRAAPGHQLGVDDPVSQVASHQPGQAVGHTTGDTKYSFAGWP